MAGDRGRPHLGESASRDLGGDVGIAVPIAADPGAVPQDDRQFGSRSVLRVDRVGKIAVEGGDGVPDGAAEMVEAVANLVDDLEPTGPDLVGGQQEGERLAHGTLGASELDGRRVLQIVNREQIGDAGLLLHHAAPARLGGVGGQRRLDVQHGERLQELFERASSCGQRADGLRDRFGPRMACPRLPLPLPVDPHDVDLLRLVAEMESDRQELEGGVDVVLAQSRQRRVETTGVEHLSRRSPDVVDVAA